MTSLLDRQKAAEANGADTSPWAINSDTGNKTCEREVIAISRWDHERDEPVASALGCVHISHDQSGRNGGAVLARAVKDANLNPKLCAGAQGDSTGHAEVQRSVLQDDLVQRGLDRSKMIISGCIRHFKELELKAATTGGWGKVSVENFLWTFRWVLHKDLPFWRVVWTSPPLSFPVDLFDRCLAQMPAPTSSKWECMDACLQKMEQLFAVHESMRGIGMTMIEEFVKRARDLLRGTSDIERPQAAGTHGDRDKFDVFAVDLQNMQLVGGLYASRDLAMENTGPFHHWCKSRCPLYGWACDFKAHLIAVKACEEAEWWAAGVADPAVAFPRLVDFMKRDRVRQGNLMTSAARSELKASMQRALADGQKKHEEWMLQQYTAAPFLFGLLCDERHRCGAARAILRAAGHGDALDAHLSAKGLPTTVEAAGPVQRRLFACLLREQNSGGLRKWWESWQMDVCYGECLRLASTPPQAYEKPLLQSSTTPSLWSALRPLFVLMVHNTRLESYVSKHKQLETSSMTAGLVDAMFMAHASLERERALLSASTERSLTRGACTAAAKAKATEGRCLQKAYISKAQRRGMVLHVMAQGSQFKGVKWRGQGSVAQLLKAQRSASQAVTDANVERRYHSLSTSCRVTATGRARAALPPVAAVAYKAPDQSGGGRGAAAIASRKRVHSAEQHEVRESAAKVVKKRRDGRPLTAAQQRKAAAPSGSGLAKLAPPKAQLSAAQLARQAEARRDTAQLFASLTKRRLEGDASDAARPPTATHGPETDDT